MGLRTEAPEGQTDMGQGTEAPEAQTGRHEAQDDLITELSAALTALREAKPLIHCITSPISINDCANAILALGGRPIMAEHPAEAAGITGIARGLSVTFANITDARAESMMLSGREALRQGIPSVIDMVGVNCSPFRMERAHRFLEECRPALVKGNASELRALFGAAHGISGIDTAEADKVWLDRREALKELSDLMIRFSRQHGTAVLISGETDLVTDGEGLWAVENGVAEMGLVTGTGCMLSCVSALTLSAFGREGAGKAALLAAGIMGLAGEEAKRAVLKGLAAGTGETKGPLPLGAFHMGLLDAFSTLTPEKFREGARIQRIF